jgi:hypothetical protein
MGLTTTCEVTVNVGTGGGVFDLSRAREGNVSFTNTVMNVLIPVMYDNQKDIFTSGYYPNLGPQWNIEGRLTVKGNGNQEFVINDGERIAQMVVARHETVEWTAVEELGETERGAGGFGHTGV